MGILWKKGAARRRGHLHDTVAVQAALQVGFFLRRLWSETWGKTLRQVRSAMVPVHAYRLCTLYWGRLFHCGWNTVETAVVYSSNSKPVVVSPEPVRVGLGHMVRSCV